MGHFRSHQGIIFMRWKTMINMPVCLSFVIIWSGCHLNVWCVLFLGVWKGPGLIFEQMCNFDVNQVSCMLYWIHMWFLLLKCKWSVVQKDEVKPPKSSCAFSIYRFERLSSIVCSHVPGSLRGCRGKLIHMYIGSGLRRNHVFERAIVAIFQ